jgi:hypothetical protein
MGTGSFGYTLDISERVLNSGDQLFADMSNVNPVYWDYHLRQPCTAIDFGQNTGLYTDYYGQAVPSGNTPDVGIAENITTFTVLPLQFTAIRGWANTTGNTIEWETTNDVAAHFEIERSNNGSNFKKIAVVPYKTNTGTTSIKYQYIDNNVKGDVQYYRIKAIKPDNTGLYSQIISIKSGGVSAAKISVSPNPAQDYVYVRVAGNDYQNKELVLLTMSGVILKRTRMDQAGSALKLNVSMLPAGAYIIKLTDTKTGEFQSTIFTK